MLHRIIILLLAAEPCLSAVTKSYCPPTGPVLPPPNIPENFGDEIISTLAGLGSTNTPWNYSRTSFSVEITSKEKTFLQYHHTAEVKSENGVQTVDTDTVYRIASITKAINVYLLLIQAPELLEHSIAQYVPELEGLEGYEDITFRMLASQLSGIWRGERFNDLAVMEGDALQNLGFPKPDPKDVPTCDTLNTGVACSRTEFFNDLRNNNFTWLPGNRAAYASGSYVLMGYALENIKGKTFEELLEESITKPLNLSSTGLKAPDVSRAAVPEGPLGAIYGLDVGTLQTTAGMYSSPRDLSRLLRSILNHELLSPTRVRQWLKPSAFAGSFSTAVGMPWEIYRMWHVTSDNRPIDVYTKSGYSFVYAGYIILLPDYDIGITILVSGDRTSLDVVESIADLVIGSLVPALDKLAKEQADGQYGGLYQATSEETMEPDSQLLLSVDDGPGLKIDRWTSKGHSMLDFVVERTGQPSEDVEARLYPVGEKNRWRMSVESVHRSDAEPQGPSRACQAWLRTDQLRYASLPVDEFVFTLEDGKVVGVQNLGLRTHLNKTE